ncbi:MAG: YcxB family protein [Bacteroidales bacterium]|jgi:Ca2+/Na+ antiporter|nr:YcxB family protein [Bacteroidales bacterium]
MNIEVSYTIKENDYLVYQLYAASKSKRVKASRRKGYVYIIFIFMMAVILSYALYKNITLPLTYLILMVVFCFSYHYFSRWYYKRHYKRYIEDIFKNNFGEKITVTFGEDFLYTSDRTGESKINLSQISEIDEINTHYFLHISSGQALIIPKEGVQNIEDIKKALDHISSKNTIQQNTNPEWKWK